MNYLTPHKSATKLAPLKCVTVSLVTYSKGQIILCNAKPLQVINIICKVLLLKTAHCVCAKYVDEVMTHGKTHGKKKKV